MESRTIRYEALLRALVGINLTLKHSRDQGGSVEEELREGDREEWV